MISVDGRREFILGLYQLPKSEGAFAQAQMAGFNLINRPPTREAYDEAQRHGLWGWSSLGSLPENSRVEAQRRLGEIVALLREHPALLFWETEDEPAFTWKEPAKIRIPPQRIIETAAVVRQLDPKHPLYLNHSPTNLVPTLQQYNPAADIVATDIYPVIPPGIGELYALWPDGRQGDLNNHTLSQVGQYADKMRAVAGSARAVFMVLQGFAWEHLREKGVDPAKVLYPTEAQLRFMAWQSVVHGANGLIWWGLAFAPPESSLWTGLQRVAQELASVRGFLAAGKVELPIRIEYHDTGHTLDKGIEWLAKRERGETLLAAVNADPNPVEASLSGLDEFAEIRSVIGPASSGTSRGPLRAQFAPFDTRVWRLR